MIYGLIISAGKQRRFEDDKPKALASITDNSTLLDYNIENMKTVCDQVYVVCSFENEHWFLPYERIVIDSGKGCGDAVMQALKHIKLLPEDTVFIQWGDSLQPQEIFTFLASEYRGKFVIPCVFEEHPYVCVVPDGETVNVYFSKYGEWEFPGYHDLSLFYGNAANLLFYLEVFSSQISVDGCYCHKHGNEMQFLDVFNDTCMPAEVVVVKDYKGFAFNTQDEFKKCLNKFEFST